MRLSLLYLLVCCCQYVLAQEYLPLPTQEVEWTRWHQYPAQQNNSTDESLTTETTHYAPLADTIIAGVPFTALYASEGTYFSIQDAYYVGAYKTEGARTWFWAKQTAAPYLLYDFSLQKGDTLSIEVDCENTPLCPVYVVESVDTILLEDNKARLRLNIFMQSEKIGRYAFSWIEGIGSTLGFFNELSCQQTLEPNCEYALLCYQEEGQQLYVDPVHYDGKCYIEDKDAIGSTTDLERSPAFSVFPNPATEVLTVEMLGVSTLAIQPYQLYATTGELVATGELQGKESQLDISRLSPGIYTLLLTQQGSISVGRFIKQ
jgi:hypothetical protein